MRAVALLLVLMLLPGCLENESDGGVDAPEETVPVAWDGSVASWRGDNLLRMTLPPGHVGGAVLMDVDPSAWRVQADGTFLDATGTIGGVTPGTWVGVAWFDLTDGTPRFLAVTHDVGNRTFERHLAYDQCAGTSMRILMTVVAEAPLPEFEVRAWASAGADATQEDATLHGLPTQGFVGLYAGSYEPVHHNVDVNDTRGPGGPTDPLGSGRLRLDTYHEGPGFHYLLTGGSGGAVAGAGEWAADAAPDGQSLRVGGSYAVGADAGFVLVGFQDDDLSSSVVVTPTSEPRPFWRHYVGVVPLDGRMLEGIDVPAGWVKTGHLTFASTTTDSAEQRMDGCFGGP